MPNPILPRRSFTPSAVPVVSTDISAPGELVINWADKIAYTKDAAGNLITVPLGGGGGSGLTWSSVPASATATGTAGSIAYDGNYVYVATGASQWKRSALSTWTLDQYLANVSLLLHLDGANGATATVDSSLSPKTITLNNSASLSSTQSKFGGTSLYTGGGNNAHALTAHSADLSLGTGDFTVECWINATASPSDKGIFDCRSGQVGTEAQRQDGFTLTAFSSSVIRIYSDAVLISSSGTDYANKWVHVAVVRSSGVMALYVDGVSQGTNSAVRNMTNDDFVIGAGRYGGSNGGSPASATSDTISNFPGYIDEFRVTKGIARYTGNFTPPTAAFTVT